MTPPPPDEGRTKWVARVIRASAQYDEIWIPCWNASPACIEAELGYFDALKGSD